MAWNLTKEWYKYEDQKPGLRGTHDLVGWSDLHQHLILMHRSISAAIEKAIGCLELEWRCYGAQHAMLSEHTIFSKVTCPRNHMESKTEDNTVNCTASVPDSTSNLVPHAYRIIAARLTMETPTPGVLDILHEWIKFSTNVIRRGNQNYYVPLPSVIYSIAVYYGCFEVRIDY